MIVVVFFFKSLESLDLLLLLVVLSGDHILELFTKRLVLMVFFEGVEFLSNRVSNNSVGSDILDSDFLNGNVLNANFLDDGSGNTFLDDDGSSDVLVNDGSSDLILYDVLSLLMNHIGVDFLDDVLVLLVDDGLNNFVDELLVDHRLDFLVEDGLMVLVNDLLVMLVDNILVVFVDNILMLFLDNGSVDSLLDDFVLHVSLDLLAKNLVVSDNNGVLVLDYHGLLGNLLNDGSLGGFDDIDVFLVVVFVHLEI